MLSQMLSQMLTMSRAGLMRCGATTVRGNARGVLLVAALTLGLSACSGGGDIDIGGGQSADPATVDFPIAYVKRTTPDPADDDIRDMRTFFVDADVFVKDRADASVTERNITERITGTTDMWDVRDLEVSFDGTRMAFAMRGPMIPNGDEEDQPTWNVWEYFSAQTRCVA